MNRVPVEVSPVALSDLIDIIFFIEDRSPQNADLVERAFLRVLDRLAEAPTLGHIHPDIGDDSVRFVPFKSFEAAYPFIDGTVGVIRVLHSARDYTRFDWR